MRILIVDGSKQRRLELVETLGELVNVVIQGAVTDVTTALTAIVDSCPDVVVVGALLPDGHGQRLIERVRHLQRPPEVVVVTASDHERERYMAAGADYCVVGDGALATTLAMLARTSRAADAIPPVYTFELLGRLAAGVAHDLNNYLLVIVAELALLKRRSPAMFASSQIDAALEAMARIDHKLLDYARGAAPTRTAIDVGAVVRDALAITKALIPATVQVELELTGSVHQVAAIRSDLEQLVLNLVINACDAMSCGGTLTIAVRDVPCGVALEISDTGRGDAPQPPPKHLGAGLGLGIVAAVVDRHRGTVRVSTRPGGGTLVTVVLPSTRS
jgi:signal transduction histidine kinase